MRRTAREGVGVDDDEAAAAAATTTRRRTRAPVSARGWFRRKLRVPRPSRSPKNAPRLTER
jgi:hypothetical protein